MGPFKIRRFVYMAIAILGLYTARRSITTIAQRSNSTLRAMSTTNAGPNKEENVWDYPRYDALGFVGEGSILNDDSVLSGLQRWRRLTGMSSLTNYRLRK